MSRVFRRFSQIVIGFTLASLAPTFAQEKTQLLFWGGSEAVDELEQYIARFNETHPDIEVTYESQPNLREILRTALAAGEGPDIVYGGTGPGAAGVLVNAGLLLPLDEAYAEYGWNDRFSDFTIERASIDGTVYGIGNEIEYIGMFYNERIFDELGLSVPESHDEVLQLCQTLQEAGFTPHRSRQPGEMACQPYL
jgi:raffinose/stachyose/melibiose transport system substrate-binding protein